MLPKLYSEESRKECVRNVLPKLDQQLSLEEECVWNVLQKNPFSSVLQECVKNVLGM